MKKMIATKKRSENISEKEVSDLKVKKLTLKTGVKAGLIGTCETSCCACTCKTATK
ncbi:MAG TPA: hypothetical protein VFS43_15495 [Polyangiaceae bacterium]|nr:hypothetical protein [Polyangiaceae bacterium]